MTATIGAQADEILHLRAEIERLRARIVELEMEVEVLRGGLPFRAPGHPGEQPIADA